MNEILFIIFVLFVLPILAYMITKYATLGYYMGKRHNKEFREDSQQQEDIDTNEKE